MFLQRFLFFPLNAFKHLFSKTLVPAVKKIKTAVV
jgi:hypothetical protein